MSGSRFYRSFLLTRCGMMAPACRERRGHLRITLFFPAIVLVFSCFASHAQSNEWAWMSGNFASGSFGVYGTMGTPAPANAPGGRDQPVTWTDSKGNLWLFGGDGFDSAGNPGYLNDLWEFSSSTNEWTWIGGSSNLGSGFSQGAGVYGVLGTPAAGNIPPGRSGAVSWTDAKGNLWLFGGFSYSVNGLEYFNDLWEYNPATNEWAWMSGSQTAGQSGVYGTEGQAASNNVPGARNSALSWTDQEGDLWLFGERATILPENKGISTTFGSSIQQRANGRGLAVQTWRARQPCPERWELRQKETCRERATKRLAGPTTKAISGCLAATAGSTTCGSTSLRRMNGRG